MEHELLMKLVEDSFRHGFVSGVMSAPDILRSESIETLSRLEEKAWQEARERILTEGETNAEGNS